MMKTKIILLFTLLPVFAFAQTGTRDNAGLQGNAGAASGFFETNNPVNYPANASSWWHLLDIRHSNSVNNFAMQFAGSFYDQNLYFRKTIDIASNQWSKVILETNGKVGIGTSDPSYKFNVAQDISMNPDIDVAQFGISGSTDNRKRLVLGYDVNGAGFGFIKAGWLNQQWTNLSLQPNGGNVGIGITNPGEKLSVNGNIRAKEVKVETANWPDYVFEPDYKITSLTDLESYIKANNHLPDMPTAKEAETNGIELGKMSKKLLQKVEELTVHLIEKEKEMVELRKQFLKEQESNRSKINSIQLKLKALSK